MAVRFNDPAGAMTSSLFSDLLKSRLRALIQENPQEAREAWR
jgi:hypothetical protein